MFRDYASYIKNIFGERVQKIALNPGFGCPNRDGKIGIGGCSYCNNKTFSPYYGTLKTVEEQLNEGISFFSKKYKAQKYIAYFQSYTNTYAEVEKLEKIFNSALNRDDVVGLAVATRPDCVDENVLALLENYSKKYYTVLELGVESCYNQTLKAINRGHSFEQAKDAIIRANKHNLEVCAHLIMYLPCETKKMMLNTAKIMTSLPVKILKLHQLQIIKGTKMEQDFITFPQKFNLPTADEYINFCIEYIKLTNNKIIFERFVSESPRKMVVAPDWGGLKNYQITERIKKAFV